MMCVRPQDCPHCRVRDTLLDGNNKRKWDALMTSLRMSPVDTPAEIIVSRAERFFSFSYSSPKPMKKVSVMRSQTQHKEKTITRATMMFKLFKKGSSTWDIAQQYGVPEAEVQRLISLARQLAKERH